MVVYNGEVMRSAQLDLERRRRADSREGHLGKLNIPRWCLRDHPDEVRGLFAHLEVLVLRAEDQFERDTVEYCVDSPLFRPVPFGQEVPIYRLDFLRSMDYPNCVLEVIVHDCNNDAVLTRYVGNAPVVHVSVEISAREGRSERKPPKQQSPLRRQLIVD
jgi:hypothetical protein